MFSCLIGLGFLASLALSVPVAQSREDLGPLAGTAPVPKVNSLSPQVQSPVASSSSTVPFGSIIDRCSVSGTFALTFDDGPYIYTAQILDLLKSNGVTATFFVNGLNWGDIRSDANVALIKRMVAEGHQVGSHTWSHADLATLSHDDIVSQMRELETALSQILGNYPAYMRPPYFSSNALVLQTMAELGYHVIQAAIDTLDWANDSQDGIQVSVQRFKDGINAGGSMELSHDVHQWTANVLVQAMIDEVKGRGLRAVTVGECLGDSKDLWYRTS